MSIQTHSLEPRDALDFVEFFEVMDFKHAEHWRGCFCQYYHLKGLGEKWMKTCRDNAREIAIINVNVAHAYTRGFLALDGERIVGWCHTNDQAKFFWWIWLLTRRFSA